jgi:phosphohistidine phosphatase SixA
LRRTWLRQALALTALPWALEPAAADPTDAARSLLQQGGGGLVVAMRHALAPGTFDPPGFRLGDCSTQRNLSDEGRAQAQRIGAWFRQHGLVPTAVRSSEWCRCRDTAQLAFGPPAAWPALNSLARDRANEATQTAALRDELARLAAQARPGFEVWVTHQANIGALVGEATASGAAVLLRHRAAGEAPALLATLQFEPA